MEGTAQGTERLAEVRRLTEEIAGQPVITDGHFNAMAMLVTDASLAGDDAALELAHRGLQWLVHRHEGQTLTDSERSEVRGRLLGLIDAAHWALRRVPSGLQLSLDPQSHAARFLLAVARQPGLSNQDLGARLGVDQTEVSRVGRRLLSAGVVWRRREWRRNLWDVTPRGRSYLESSPLSAAVGVPSGPPVDLALTHAIGVKVLPTSITGVLVGPGGRRTGEPLVRQFTDRVGVTEAAALIAEFVAALTAAHPAVTRPGLGLGVEIGGHVRADAGVVVNAPGYSPDWNGAQLRARLGEALHLPVAIENDANALAVYEQGFGDLVDVDNAATVLVADGVGCGLIVNGALLQGTGGSAGELGHLVVAEEHGAAREAERTLCRAGHRGCLETLAGVPSIVARVRAEPHLHDVTDLHEAVLRASKEMVVPETFRRAGGALGQSLAALENLVNPSRIVVYGPEELLPDDTQVGEEFHDSMLHAIRAHTFSTAYDDCTISYKRYAAVDGARAAGAVALLRLTVMD